MLKIVEGFPGIRSEDEAFRIVEDFLGMWPGRPGVQVSRGLLGIYRAERENITKRRGKSLLAFVKGVGPYST